MEIFIHRLMLPQRLGEMNLMGALFLKVVNTVQAYMRMVMDIVILIHMLVIMILREFLQLPKGKRLWLISILMENMRMVIIMMTFQVLT